MTKFTILILLVFSMNTYVCSQTKADRKSILKVLIDQIDFLDGRNLNEIKQTVVYVLDNEIIPKLEFDYMDKSVKFIKTGQLEGKSYLELGSFDFTNDHLIHVIYKYNFGSTNEYRMLQIEKKNANWKVTQTTNFE